MTVRYSCYRDATDLTALVALARQVPVAGTTVVMALTDQLSDGAVDELATAHRGLPRQRDEPEGRVAKGGPAKPGWEVQVTCPQEGCSNVFSSATVAAQGPTHDHLTIVGRPPTDTDTYLFAAAKELGPDKSLTRASDSAKFVITNISLVALVAGGSAFSATLKGGSTITPGSLVRSSASRLWRYFPQSPRSFLVPRRT
jgi:hypothetical protein